MVIVLTPATSTHRYHVRVQVLNASAVLPQARERLFFACFRCEAAARAFRWPTFPSQRPAHVATLSDVLEKLSPSELAMCACALCRPPSRVSMRPP